MAQVRARMTTTQEVEVYVDTMIDVDIDDIFDEMSESDKETMLDYIIDDMSSKKLTEFINKISPPETSFEFSRYDTGEDTAFADALIKIFNLRIKLSAHQIDNLVAFSNSL